MAFSISSMPKYPYSSTNTIASSPSQYISIKIQCLATKCELDQEPSKEMKLASKGSKLGIGSASKGSKLGIGSPIVVVEAPKMIKTAASVPCLRVNAGLVKPGDVGRILSRKPKDVWAVRLSIGTYLIDGKYFKPLEELAD
ncbi:uncharacterized protein LOC113770489 isoform X1 [Coffea eugenioides]|uniref:uncharacterized protein LOC113770489 isoform X1 n=1 Tax=Coffea eugenioides TaxID=49369 RepID=UPI000F5D1041|nr:uncharacterized protein LOC113688144 [Coffea arabica]XP_027170758.1 uncharacterized protein LOC113770489 isoform X1 [Coffea eugenioides]